MYECIYVILGAYTYSFIPGKKSEAWQLVPGGMGSMYIKYQTGKKKFNETGNWLPGLFSRYDMSTYAYKGFTYDQTGQDDIKMTWLVLEHTVKYIDYI